jgi:hypothetical protein
MIDAPDAAVRRAVRRLLEAIDRALAAAREIERARTDLDRTARRRPLRVITPEREDHRATAEQ